MVRRGLHGAGPRLWEDPTFSQLVETVVAKDAKAKLRLTAYGAFTVGVEAGNGKTRLELDLSEDPSFPKEFRER